MLTAPVRPHRRRCKSKAWMTTHDLLARQTYGFTPAQDGIIEAMCRQLAEMAEADVLSTLDMDEEQASRIRESF